jgi:hypothetical protein
MTCFTPTPPSHDSISHPSVYPNFKEVTTPVPHIVTAGDTRRLKVTFLDWDEQPVDPAEITFTAYAEDMTVETGFPVTLGAEHKVTTGVYKYDYTAPSTPGTYIAEFKGTASGTTVLKRMRLEVKNVVEGV